MKVLDLAGAQRLWNAMTQRINAAGGGGSLAQWHRLVLEDSYDTGPTSNLAAYLTNLLLPPANNYSGYIDRQWLPPVLPTITVSDHTWSEPDSEYRRTTTADIIVTFPDGSSLRKTGVTFTNYHKPSGRVYGVQLSNVASYIDTGLTLDYSYEFRAKGYTTSGSMSVLVGASASTSARTTMRLLGSANKVQAMWPGNVEITTGTSGINCREAFEYVQNARGITMTQGATTYEHAYSGTANGTDSAKIILLNDMTNTNNSGYGVFIEAEIRDGDGTVLRHFEPWWMEEEGLVIIDTANNNQSYRPVNGSLVEVTQEG